MPDDAFDLLEAIEDYVARAVTPLRARIGELEQEVASLLLAEKGADGENGKDAEVDYALVADMLKAMLTNVPPGKPGADGKDAEVDYDRVGNIIAVAVEKEVGKRPPAKDGNDGKDGRDGERGERGEDADEATVIARVLALIPKPENGHDGKEGRDGKDADEAAIVEKVLAQLPPPKDGRDFDPDLMRAEIGRLVAEIPKPEPGKSVHPDTVAVMVRDAVAEFVKSIDLPKDGAPGRDALDLEIIETIERDKSYPVGTFALHDGGTMLAVRDTDPLETVTDALAAGWKVTQDGIKAVEREDSADARMTRLVVRATSGRTFAVDCMTGMQDQGVHRAGMRYRAGDCVTYDESYWTARRETTKAPPGDDWRLILKGKRR